MVFKKIIVQKFSGKEPFGFDDFIRGTLFLLKYAIHRDIDVKINIAGSEFEEFMLVKNFVCELPAKIYYAEIDKTAIIKDLDDFMSSPDPLFVVTSNVALERSEISNLSFVKFDSLVRYKDELFAAAQQKASENLIYRANPDNLLYGYNIIYIIKEHYKFKLNRRNLISLAEQIRKSVDLNKDTMIFSNNIQFRKILKQYVEMNYIGGAIQTIDESDIDIGVEESLPSVREKIIDFLLLMKSRKIFHFTSNYSNSKDLRYQETALDMNTFLGNLEIQTIPLYYQTYTIVGCSKPTHPARLTPNQPGVELDSSGNYISVLANPSGIALDLSGNIFISDTSNNRICKLDTSGIFTTYAGSLDGSGGYVDDISFRALFNGPTAIALDRSGKLYVADTGNNLIRVIDKNTMVVGTLVGNNSEFVLNAPRGVAVDSKGYVYFSDTGNHRICKVVGGGNPVITLAGSTTLGSNVNYLSGYLNGPGKYASFHLPTGLAVDLIGNIYVADTGNNVIRRVTQDGNVSTVAGSGQPGFKEGKREKASFNIPVGIAIDLQGILYISDTGNNVIRRIITDGDVIPVVGSPDQKYGSIDGYGAIDPMRALVPFNKRATFYSPSAIAINPARRLFIADTYNNTVRRVDPTFSNPTAIKPIATQTLKIINSPGVGLSLGPTLSASADFTPMTIGHRKGFR